MQLLFAHISTCVLVPLYRLFRLQRRRHKVVIFSRQSSVPSRDISMLADELRRQDPSLELVVRCREVGSGLRGQIAYAREMVVQTFHLSSASVCVIDGYIAPVSVLRHPPALTVIQMWHALGAVKQFGLQAVGKPGGRPASLARAMRMHRNYDYVLYGGPASVQAFAQAFGVRPEQVVCTGLPRVDAARRIAARDVSEESHRIAELRAASGDLLGAERTKVLYAPTFRRNAPTDFAPVITAFAGSGLTLIIKPHDLERGVDTAPHVVDATGCDILELIALADIVVTDYSAVAFEAAAVGRPVYFYLYDVERYERDLGLNMDPRAVMPDVTATEIGTIVESIRTVPYPVDALAAFAEDYVTVPPSGCTAAIAGLVLRTEKELGQ